MSAGSSMGDRVVSRFGERVLTPLAYQMDSLVQRLAEDAAIGLILIDATPLVEIERLYGAAPLSRALETLGQRVHARVAVISRNLFTSSSSSLGKPRNTTQRSELIFSSLIPGDF